MYITQSRLVKSEHQSTYQIRGQPFSFFLKLVDDGSVDRRHLQVQLLVSDLQVDVGEAQVVLPDQRPNLLHRLKGLGVGLQTFANLSNISDGRY